MMTDTQRSARTTTRMSYRAWVEAGARGYFLAPSVAVNEARLINPADRRGGYFVRRDLSDPQQEERRRQLRQTDRAEWTGGEHSNQIVTARVERAAEVARRGWLTWETVGDVVILTTSGAEQREEHA